FGVTRPSLSRELNKMRKEGLINLTRKTIIINNLSLLEQNL
ncbi:MAG TPA: helix-turn-helix domain-containing protein, partial [Atribacterota bacterium]|nr:helix-turn-helix domain-containing protein [Atribacterota bacterium]